MTDISNDAYIARVAVCEAAAVICGAMTAPHVLYKPALLVDGTKWCASLRFSFQVQHGNRSVRNSPTSIHIGLYPVALA